MRKLLLISLILSLLVSSHALAQESAGITHGPLSGEVSAEGVTLWARGENAGTLLFEIADNADFSGDVTSVEVEVDEDSDFTGETRVDGLTPATQYFYRVALDGGEARTGQFKTAPDSASGFDFVFGACLGGQGYCRNPETGWEIFNTMLAQEPDFFLLTGDGVYASGGCPANEGQNVPGAETPAFDLASFRARYRYHLEDEHYANFLANTPVYTGWDDHEVRDNYSAGVLNSLNPQLLNDAREAFFEYWPVMGTEENPYKLYRSFTYGDHAEFFILDTRSHRDPIVNWDPSPVNLAPKTMLGAEQFAWLQDGLKNSSATWKFIVTSVPLAYPTGFPQPQVDGRDGWANGADRSGYESELIALTHFFEAQAIENVVFLSGDTHWPFALSYDPDRDGEPNFYELSSSPMSAIVLPPPAQIDPTFNPTVLYAEGEFQGSLFNFGQITIADNGDLTFRILDREGVEHFSLALQSE